MWCMISWVSKKREVSTCFPKSDYWRSQSDEENTCLFIVVCSSWSKSLKSTILKTESIILVKLPIVCSALYWVDGIWDRILVGCGRRSGCGSCTCCCMPCLAVTISWIVDVIVDDVGISLYGWWLFLLHVRRLPWLELMLGEDWKAKTENSVIGGIFIEMCDDWFYSRKYVPCRSRYRIGPKLLKPPLMANVCSVGCTRTGSRIGTLTYNSLVELDGRFEKSGWCFLFNSLLLGSMT